MSESKPLPTDVLENAAAMLHVLGHPHRLQICDLLLFDELCVNALAERLGDHPNAVSQHLNMMRAVGLLKGVRRGKRVYYHVTDSRIRSVLGCLRKTGCDRREK
jgi:DNA-binding transcriptional ArsR family regulator